MFFFFKKKIVFYYYLFIYLFICFCNLVAIIKMFCFYFIFALLLLLLSTFSADSAATALRHADLWEFFDPMLSVGRAYGAVLFANGSFFVVGGCNDAACTKMVDDVDIIDSQQKNPARHVKLPKMIDPLEGKEKKPADLFEPLFTVAGPSAIVRVDKTENLSGSDNSSNSDGEPYSFYIPGPCVYYFSSHDKSLNSSSYIWQKHAKIWHLSSDLSHVIDSFDIYPTFTNNVGQIGEEKKNNKEGFPFRVNSTCVAREQLIWIIGGVDIITGETLDSVDVYNTVTRKYMRSVSKLMEAVQNPFATVDNKFIYIAGGKRQVFLEKSCLNCDVKYETNEKQKLNNCFGNCSKQHDDDSGGGSKWQLSTMVQMIPPCDVLNINFSNYRENNFLTPCPVFPLPSNPLLSIYGRRGDNNNNNNDVVVDYYYIEKPEAINGYLFAFNGKLCFFTNTNFLNCLDMEGLLLSLSYKTSQNYIWEETFFSETRLFSVSMSMPFAFPLSVGVLGYELALFEFGGFINKSTDATTQIFYRTSGLTITGVPKLEMCVKPNVSLNITLLPATEGFVRLSNNPICVGNSAGTVDTFVAKNINGSTIAVFYPTMESFYVYVCFANRPVPPLPCKEKKCEMAKMNTFLYTPITYTPFCISNNKPSTDFNKNEKSYLVQHFIISACIMVALFTVVILILMFARLWGYPTKENDKYAIHLLCGQENPSFVEEKEKEENPPSVSVVVRKQPKEVVVNNAASNKDDIFIKDRGLFALKSERDVLVQNTTHSSRYKVVRRIGEGAFSSVYLVERKDDRQLFALKYLICKNNKERLSAIQECETINTLQGHPNIIRLVDMFMNYEFDGSREVGPAGTISSKATVVNGKKFTPQLLNMSSNIEKNMNNNVRPFIIMPKEQKKKKTKQSFLPSSQPSCYLKHITNNLQPQASDIVGKEKRQTQQQQLPKCGESCINGCLNIINGEVGSFTPLTFSPFFPATTTNTAAQCGQAQENGTLLHEAGRCKREDFTAKEVDMMMNNINCSCVPKKEKKRPHFQEDKKIAKKTVLNEISPVMRPQPQEGKYKCEVAGDFLQLPVVARRTRPVKKTLPAPAHVHTRYLCLVMEYHPLGDLCSYVLRNSAKHNAELRQELQEEIKEEEEEEEKNVMENNDEKNCVENKLTGTLNQFSFLSPISFSGTSCCREAQSKSTLGSSTNFSCYATAGSSSGIYDSSFTESNDNSNSNSSSCLIGDLRRKAKEKKKDIIMRANAFTEPQLLSIAYQLCSVLCYLHSQRMPIVHRDLKPENILISGEPYLPASNERSEKEKINENFSLNLNRNGDCLLPLQKPQCGSCLYDKNCNHHSLKFINDFIPIVVTDFGLAFLQEERCFAGRGGGTRPYIAPECWSGQTTTASDMWSFGCVLYALATARVTMNTVRIMFQEAKNEGFAKMVINDILAENYSLLFAKFVLSLLVVDVNKRPSAKMALRCFVVDDGVVRLNPDCVFC